MAKKMSYTDPETGAVYPESVWLPKMEEADFDACYLRVEFRGYATLEAAKAGKQPIGRKVYTIANDPWKFMAFIAPLLGPVSQACYDLAADTHDTAVAGEGGAVTQQPFFLNSEDVDVPPPTLPPQPEGGGPVGPGMMRRGPAPAAPQPAAEAGQPVDPEEAARGDHRAADRGPGVRGRGRDVRGL